MPSVDVVSKVDLQVLDNAINNVKREIFTRFDFKNVKSEIILDRKAKCIHIVTGDDLKVKAVKELLFGQCIRLKEDPKCLDIKKIVKLIKGRKLKVQPAIQDDQVRITGKKIDDLQEIMRLLKEQDYDIPLQFVNMKS